MKLNKPYTNKDYADLAVYCNSNNCHIEDKGDYLESVENPKYILTKEEVEVQRRAYRQANIDDLTLARLRKQANQTWTEEDEQAYLALDLEITAYLEENFPYPTEE